jgi:tRNA dimethylallyltransferase
VPEPPALLAVVGATGTGKSALADALACELDGEVVSADSMQVYRGMDVGTAKMPPSRRSVPYHCVDMVEPDESFTAALYQRAARAAIAAIRARGRRPVFCGGTGLYLRAALDDFAFDGCFDEPSLADAAANLRQRLEARAMALGPDDFHAELAARDPESAALIHPHNVRRVVRAFELLGRGSSYAEQSAGFSTYRACYPGRYLGIAVEPQLLYQVIERRVDAMMADGLLEEVRGLLERGLLTSPTAGQAIGYRELAAHLLGRVPLEEAIGQVKQATRRYAKRQRTWFTRDARVCWIEASDLHRLRLEGRLDEQGFTSRLLSRAQGLLE